MHPLLLCINYVEKKNIYASMMKLCDLQGLNCNVCMHPWWSCVISRDSTAMCVCIHDEAVLSLGAQLQCIYASMMKLVISSDSTATYMYVSMMKLCDLQGHNCNICIYICIHDEAVLSPGTQLQCVYAPMMKLCDLQWLNCNVYIYASMMKLCYLKELTDAQLQAAMFSKFKHCFLSAFQ